MQLRWAGFRRVRRQVCRRIGARMRALGIASTVEYRAYLEHEPAEWPLLDALCHITISRFYRDRALFDTLRDEILPALASGPFDEAARLRCWSAGCASGEEAYTLALIWHFAVAPRAPRVQIEITATDLERPLLARARRACYPRSSLRELPAAWLAAAFETRPEGYCLIEALRADVRFLEQDLRKARPDGRFQLILCRNLAFTYFAPAVQQQVLAHLRESLAPRGILVLGAHERLPPNDDFQPLAPGRPLYRRRPLEPSLPQPGM
ncbi:chemotaxis protein CheR [Ectothiorhodospiraceae bacterium 2226]|nr:chemotaxis protein CheR [Ectothiorhodospiraceae bacterium 2226]